MSGSGDHAKLFWFSSFVGDVLLYTGCLVDLGAALERPALQVEHKLNNESIALHTDLLATTTRARMRDSRVGSATTHVNSNVRNEDPVPTESGVAVMKTSFTGDVTDSTAEEHQSKPVQSAIPASKEPGNFNSDKVQPLMPMSLLDYSYEDTFAALDANGPFTILDLKYEDTRPITPELTTSDNTPSTRTSDLPENDDIHIRLDQDIPDAWALGFSGNAISTDMQLHEDVQNVAGGFILLPGDFDDVLLAGLETLPKQTDGNIASMYGPYTDFNSDTLLQFPADTNDQPYSLPMSLPTNPSSQNPPCNTIYISNLPHDTNEDELKAVFEEHPGYIRICFRTKQNGPMCLVEFENTFFAAEALREYHGYMLKNSTNEGMQLSFSKHSLGMRSNPGIEATATSTVPTEIHSALDTGSAQPMEAGIQQEHSTNITGTESTMYTGK